MYYDKSELKTHKILTGNLWFLFEHKNSILTQISYLNSMVKFEFYGTYYSHSIWVCSFWYRVSNSHVIQIELVCHPKTDILTHLIHFSVLK